MLLPLCRQPRSRWGLPDMAGIQRGFSQMVFPVLRSGATSAPTEGRFSPDRTTLQEQAMCLVG